METSRSAVIPFDSVEAALSVPVYYHRDGTISQFLQTLSAPAAERLSVRGFMSVSPGVLCR